jgi:hypothetical protein
MLLQNISDYVYTREDLFHETFLKELQNWNPHEIFSSNLGLCFSVKLNQNISESTQNFKFISLPVDKEYQVSKGFYQLLLTNFPLKT